MIDQPGSRGLARRTILSVATLGLVLAMSAVAEDAETGAAEADKLTKTIRWATASEVDNFGYDVYRGESEEGPFTRLTAEPIAGAGTTDEPSYYTFVDDTLEPGTDYYYYVESISVHGERERFTPIQKVPAKGADGDAKDGESADDSSESPEASGDS